jgi:hypothetical protein
VHEDIVGTTSANDFLGTKSRNALSRSVPEHDAPLTIDQIKTVVQILYYILKVDFILFHVFPLSFALPPS